MTSSRRRRFCNVSAMETSRTTPVFPDALVLVLLRIINCASEYPCRLSSSLHSGLLLKKGALRRPSKFRFVARKQHQQDIVLDISAACVNGVEPAFVRRVNLAAPYVHKVNQPFSKPRRRKQQKYRSFFLFFIVRFGRFRIWVALSVSEHRTNAGAVEGLITRKVRT